MYLFKPQNILLAIIYDSVHTNWSSCSLPPPPLHPGPEGDMMMMMAHMYDFTISCFLLKIKIKNFLKKILGGGLEWWG